MATTSSRSLEVSIPKSGRPRSASFKRLQRTIEPDMDDERVDMNGGLIHRHDDVVGKTTTSTRPLSPNSRDSVLLTSPMYHVTAPVRTSATRVSRASTQKLSQRSSYRHDHLDDRNSDEDNDDSSASEGSHIELVERPLVSSKKGTDSSSNSTTGPNAIDDHCDIRGSQVPVTSSNFAMRWYQRARTSIVQSNLYGDYANITLLFLLYVLQAVPMGISAVIPIVMQERQLGYGAQAAFTIVSLPFSFKLLWAPFVDSYYSSTIGRRKSWILPTQFICSFMLIAFADAVDGWLGAGSTSTNMFALTTFFIIAYVLMATQDIAVDAWALTMLQQKNVGYASTTNTLGQIIGISIAQMGYLLLNNPETCNKYFRSVPSDEPILGLPGMLKFWGVVFFISTFLLIFFKSEVSRHPWDTLADEKRRQEQSMRQDKGNPSSDVQIAGFSNQDEQKLSDSEGKVISRNALASVEQKQSDTHSAATSDLHRMADMVDVHQPQGELSATSNEVEEEYQEHIPQSLKETLDLVLSALRLPALQLFVLFQITSRFIISPCENLFHLKLLDRGFTKSDVALISSLPSPIAIITSVLFSKYTSGPNALKLYLLVFIPRIIVALLAVPIVYLYPAYSQTNWMLYAILLRETISNGLSTLAFMACMAFSARVADPRIGGTIMTMLNTALNLGGAIPRVIVLGAVEYLTIQECVAPASSSPFEQYSRCATDKTQGELCARAGGKCNLILDGFYVEVILFGVLGAIWLSYILPRVAGLASLPTSAWRLSSSLFSRSKDQDKDKELSRS